MHIIGMPGKERENKVEKISGKVTAKNFMKFMSDNKPQVQEARQTY